MKNRKLNQIFKGQPKTSVKFNRNGDIRVDVLINELTPLRAKLADKSASLLTLAGLGYTLYDTARTAGADWIMWIAAFAVPLAFYPLTKWSMRQQFKRQQRVRFTKEQFQMGSWPFAKRFDRQLDHSFTLPPHDKRDDEKEAIQMEVLRGRQRGKLVQPEKYYGKSFHLVFEHLGERFDITEIYGEREAKRALDRLKSIDQVIDSITGSGSGTPLSPENEWFVIAGDLPPNKEE